MALGNGSVIVAGARTPIGKLMGGFADLSAVQLGGIALRAALDRAGAVGSDVDYVIMGQVLQAGAGQIPARQAAVAAGIPMTVPALTINKVCLSGLDAVALADQLIRAGEFDVVLAGGMESMTNAPHLLPKSRHGLQVRIGRVARLDGVRRADRSLRPRRDGRVDRAPQRQFEHQPRRSRTSSPRGRTNVRRSRVRTACSTTRSSRYRCPNDAASRS